MVDAVRERRSVNLHLDNTWYRIVSLEYRARRRPHSAHAGALASLHQQAHSCSPTWQVGCNVVQHRHQLRAAEEYTQQVRVCEERRPQRCEHRAHVPARGQRDGRQQHSRAVGAVSKATRGCALRGATHSHTRVAMAWLLGCALPRERGHARRALPLPTRSVRPCTSSLLVVSRAWQWCVLHLRARSHPAVNVRLSSEIMCFICSRQPLSTATPATMHAQPSVKESANFAGKTMSTGSATTKARKSSSAPAPKSAVAYVSRDPSGSASRADCTALEGSCTAAAAELPILPSVAPTLPAALESVLDRKGSAPAEVEAPSAPPCEGAEPPPPASTSACAPPLASYAFQSDSRPLESPSALPPPPPRSMSPRASIVRGAVGRPWRRSARAAARGASQGLTE